MTKNANYEAAVEYAREIGIVEPGTDVRLVSGGRGWWGSCLQERGDRYTVQIANRRGEVRDFVETIAHEMSHVRQYREGGPQSEETASGYAWTIRNRYYEEWMAG